MNGDIREAKVLMDKYFDMFNTVFPTIGYPSINTDDFIDDIKNCIEQNKTYEQLHPEKYQDGIDY